MINPNRSLLDMQQIFQRAFEEDNDAIRVSANIVLAPGGTSEVIISHVDDSIRIGDGVDLVTLTTVGSDKGLDVNIIGGVVSGSFSPTGLNIGGRVLEVVINSTTWTALPATPLASRNAISIQNRTGVNVKINYSNSVVGFVGVWIPNGFERQYDVTEDIVIYAKSESGTVTLVVEEIA